MTIQTLLADRARQWRRVVFFRSARFSAIETALANSHLAQCEFEDLTLLVQEDAVGVEITRIFGDNARVMTVPSGPFSLSAISPDLLARLRELAADVFIIFYNNGDSRDYGDIETLGFLSGATDVMAVNVDNKLERVTPQRVAKRGNDRFARWRSSPHALAAAANFLRYLRNVRSGSDELSNYPWYMYAELSRNCNLRCPGCRGKEVSVLPDMPLESFARFIDEVGPSLYQIVLYRGGESLINKNFAEMLEYAYENTGAELILSSNMSHRLAYGDLEMLARHCHLIDVTIDGLTPKTYGEYRVRGNFDLAFSNMMKLANIASKHGNNCHIRWRFIVFSYNEHEVDEARQIAEDIGVELQLVRPQVRRVEKGVDALDLLPKDKELWRPEYGDTPVEADMLVRCGWLHGGAVLNHNMSLSPCCHMPREFAHVQAGAFHDAYNCHEYLVSRRNIICEGCEPSPRNEWNACFDSFERRVTQFLLESDLIEKDDRKWLMDMTGRPDNFRQVL